MDHAVERGPRPSLQYSAEIAKKMGYFGEKLELGPPGSDLARSGHQNPEAQSTQDAGRDAQRNANKWDLLM